MLNSTQIKQKISIMGCACQSIVSNNDSFGKDVLKLISKHPYEFNEESFKYFLKKFDEYLFKIADTNNQMHQLFKEVDNGRY